MQRRLRTRLLVVDDCDAIRRMVTAVLRRTDLLVVGEAADGRDALVLASQVQPDVVLMDYRMPVMDGMTAARLLKQSPHPPAIVLFTSDAIADLVGEAALAGVDALLEKGCSIETLRQTLVCAAQSAGSGWAPGSYSAVAGI